MTIETIMTFLVQLLAGCGVFLVGVKLLTGNIEQLATSRIKSLFNRTADKRLMNVGIGAATTALIQSSGVTTVLIVGFVNVGVMNLYQATAMIMGANIGTTITAQIAALAAFPITMYMQLLVFIGIMMAMLCSRDGWQKCGMILAGLGLVFIGLSLMSQSMEAYKDDIQVLFEDMTDPVLLLVIGILLTALVQSSSATTSIVIAMCMAGLTVGTGGNEVLFFILGTNVGSCITALMSSIGTGTNAKRASLIHLLFNIFGVVIFFVLLLLWPSFMADTFAIWFPTAATRIAMFHTFFNVVCAIIFLPFSSLFVKLSMLLIRDKQKAQEISYLDDRMLTSPSLAISQLEKETVRLLDTSMSAFRLSYQAFRTRDTSLFPSIQNEMEKASKVNQGILGYLIRLSANSNVSEEHQVVAIHSNIGDAMRIAEIADNFIKYAKRSTEENLQFSEPVKEELDRMVARVEDQHEAVKELILSKRLALLPVIASTEDEIDHMRKELIDGHIERLNQGTCRPESSSVFINLVSNLERLGDHLTYIADTQRA